MLASVVWMPVGARASYSGPIPLADLVCRAEAIVLGTVREVTLAPQGRFRLATVAVAAVAKGRDGAPRAGGTVIDRSSAGFYGGHPDYRPGERIVAFLVAIPGTPYWRTLDDSQGKFPVVDGKVPRADGAPVDRFLADLGAILADPVACRRAAP